MTPSIDPFHERFTAFGLAETLVLIYGQPVVELLLKLHRQGFMKPIVFKFKHESAEDIRGNLEPSDYAVKGFPKAPTWIHLAGFGIVAAGAGIGFWMGGNPGSCAGLLAGTAGCFVFIMTVHPIRCPRCKGRVNTRWVEEENGFKRFFHDCPVCKISWRGEKRQFEATDD